ncbi:SdrD B-like domain-containing protein [Aurantiacibacter sediminis]|nr:SdrD B-like domain-containing protein [Aurantiacibacter sediminis]
MLTSILPFLAVATPAALLAGDVSNTATVSVGGGAIDANTADNTATDEDVLLATIIAVDDSAFDINGNTGQAGVLNVFGGDTIDGNPAAANTTVVSLAPGSALPTGITFDPVTGDVGVAPGTGSGDYSFDYQICQIDAPTNCEIATVTIEVVAPDSTLSGTVFRDQDGDRDLDDGDTRLGGWIVELFDGDTLIGSIVTDENGFYEFTGLSGGVDYTIKFRDPETGVVYEQIENVRLDVASSLPDQNLPIDPSGIVYDSVARTAVPGAVLTLVDRSGNPLPDDCYIDASQSNQTTGASGAYRFDIVPGAAAACPLGESEYAIRVTPPAGFSFTSSILPPQPGPFDPTGLGSPVTIGNSANIPIESDPEYFISFRLQNGDPDIIFNHLPLDPFLSRDGLIVTKTSTRRSASVGDLVPYEITVRNEETFRRADVDVIDVLPAGMTYVLGSARVNGVAAEPELANGNRELVWTDQVIPAGSSVTYELVLLVGAGVTEGQLVNTGVAENGFDGSEISNRGTATIQVVPSTVFDCAELIGQVFEDYDGDGYQDEGEPGVPSIRLATVNGELITTDEYGRYHITCAAVPDARIGSNYVLRLDERTLPQGYSVTHDNPRSIRLTRGKMSELNFGIAEADVITLQIDARAFATDGSLNPDVLARMQALASDGDPRSLVVRANYTIAPGDTPEQVEARLRMISTQLQTIFDTQWDGPDPVIQVNATSATAAETGELGQ